MKEDIQTVSLKLLNKSDKSDKGKAKFIKLEISNENEVREKFYKEKKRFFKTVFFFFHCGFC